MKTKLIIPALLLIAATTSAQDKKDWPGIGRYEKANANTPPPTKGKVRVVYMGDSITDAWINNDSTDLNNPATCSPFKEGSRNALNISC